eukprot:TRINITY_DN3547_c0_g1_i2.p1 TRINITY_DN3547_c0_g1~~TRINITY_DN3547_c0_g1_i2.p1  ORF type:complete len:757 (-),score=88.00 TRINITY_DN3547_c0_g1_i2:160-2430(-)
MSSAEDAITQSSGDLSNTGYNRRHSSSSNEHKRRQSGASSESTAQKIVVAVNAAGKEITKHALEWAIRNIARKGDCILLLALAPSEKTVRKAWPIPIFAGDCASVSKRAQQNGNYGRCSTQLQEEVKNSCRQMMQKLYPSCDSSKVKIKIKVVPSEYAGVVAAESKKARAAWIVLEKQLKKEDKYCVEELDCNLVVMKNSGPKILKLNLNGANREERVSVSPNIGGAEKCKARVSKANEVNSTDFVVDGGVCLSSPDLGTPFTATETTTSSATSSEQEASPLLVSNKRIGASSYVMNSDFKITYNTDELPFSDSDSDDYMGANNDFLQPIWMNSDPTNKLSTTMLDTVNESFNLNNHFPSLSMGEKCSASQSGRLNQSQGHIRPTSERILNTNDVTVNQMNVKTPKVDKKDEEGGRNHTFNLDRTSSVRKAVSLNRAAPADPPPLCSICQHRSPVFGKPPRWFSYSELEYATNGFSSANFLAEGGFGSVHRGVLSDGQVVAIKQHRTQSSQGDTEFCSEVEVLSCAQHRNVVMLIGFCIEDQRRMLVYEYVCNGSLDQHLYGRGQQTLEPMVGDFGLARWQPDGNLGVETRIIGTFGYLAPEYAQSARITEKADVFSFGVVLLELVTGRKAIDYSKPRGQQCLTEWARPLLRENAIHVLIDSRLGDEYSEHEVASVLRAAALCIRKDPSNRPKMSQVLRILERDMYPSNSGSSMYNALSTGSRSDAVSGDNLISRTGDSNRRLHYSDEYQKPFDKN